MRGRWRNAYNTNGGCKLGSCTRPRRLGHAKWALLLCVASLCSVHASDLPDEIQRVLSALDIPVENVSILIEDIDSGDQLLSHLPSVPRNPASVMKLVTTWSALEVLGPAYIWPTEVYFLGSFDGETLDGDLALKGYGDPFLVQEELWKLLRALRRTGLTTINGNLVLDDSYFDVREALPGDFDNQPERTYNVVPNALLMNFKAVQFQFRPDPRGRGVNVVSEPPLSNLEIDNRIALVDGPCGGYQRGISFNLPDALEAARVALGGTFSRNCRVYSLSRTALQHDTYAFGLFSALWQEVGGHIRGQLRDAEVPEDAEPAIVWSSRPLAEIVRSINKNSNNVMTRQLLYTLGAESFGAPATRENGIAAIMALLRSRQLDVTSLNIANGAGLSRDSRISAELLVSMLGAAMNSPYAAEFVASLSIGGLDGTTRGRFDSRSGRGRTHLKTGRVDHVSALSGYVHAADGRDFALAVFVNSEDAHRGLGQEVEGAVLGWLLAQ